MKQVGVIFGGCSPEYGVSLESAYAVIQNMDREKYRPVPIGITKDGNWLYFEGDTEEIIRDTWHQGRCTPALLSPNRGDGGLLLLKQKGIGFVPLDVLFPVMHGRNGEDGSVQGLAQLSGIPLAGCGVLSSALCMDKLRAHRVAEQCGVRVPKDVVINGRTGAQELAALAETVGYPLFVKPVRAGSSYGISRVSGPQDLQAAAELAFGYDSTVILEEAVEGVEVGCAVLGNDTLITGEVDEIEIAGGFFDFAEKYTPKSSAIHVPARVDRSVSGRIKETAKALYRAMDCSGFARVDLFLTPDGEVIFNEINTIPGFTEHSRYPAMMRAAGYSFGEVLDRIIGQAVTQ